MSANTELCQRMSRCIAQFMQRHEHNAPLQQFVPEAELLAKAIMQALTVAPAPQVRGWLTHRMRSSEKPDRRKILPLNPSEIQAQMEDVKRVKKLSKKHQYSHNKLDPYRAEINLLHQDGYSLSEIRNWLWRYRRVKADKSTVSRSIARWATKSGCE